VLTKMFSSAKTVHAGIRFTDIAGLVKGASKGEGLGNQFLGNIRTVDAIATSCAVSKTRTSSTSSKSWTGRGGGHHRDGASPLRPPAAEKALDRLQGPARTGDKKAKEKLEVMGKIVQGFKEGRSARPRGFRRSSTRNLVSCRETRPLRRQHRRERGGSAMLASLQERLPGRAESSPSAPNWRRRSSNSRRRSGPPITKPRASPLPASPPWPLPASTCSADHVLHLRADESRAWMIPSDQGVKAAGKIHSDIERGFIRAETYRYEDLVACGSEKALKEKGLVSMEGKDYE